jgi:hypothetical protein
MPTTFPSIPPLIIFPGLKELALSVTTDPDHKFDLSLSLDDLDGAVDIARTVPASEATSKWKAVGDRALAVWRFDLAKESFEKADDLGSLFLLLLAEGDAVGLREVATKAGECLFQLVSVDSWVLTCDEQRREGTIIWLLPRCFSWATQLAALTSS